LGVASKTLLGLIAVLGDLILQLIIVFHGINFDQTAANYAKC